MSDIFWRNVTVALGDLKPWERNPKSISKAHAKRLLASWDKFGQFQTVAIGPGFEVYDGHQRLSVLRAAFGDGYQVDARQSSRELTDSERRELVIAAHVGTTGQFNWDELANWDAAELQEWGLDGETLQDWRTGIGALTELIEAAKPEPPEDAGAQIDKADELREKWGVETGQMWRLGEHRIICGDCTDKAVVERLLGNDEPTMTFIDPPYNALKSWKKDEAHGETRLDPSKWFANDNMEWDEYWLFIKNAFDNMAGHSVYVCCDYRIYAGLLKVLLTTPYELKHCIVWKKNVFGLGARFRFQHEFVIYACQKDAPFYGNRAESDVWEIDAVRGTNVDHNTPKPVGIPERAIACSSKENDIIYDGFVGSGTTLIACERLSRKCRAVEISPAYCAVAIQRWVDMTGGAPELITDEQ